MPDLIEKVDNLYKNYITKKDICELIDKIENFQHLSTKHDIINHLISNDYIDISDQIYHDLIRMDKTGNIKI